MLAVEGLRAHKAPVLGFKAGFADRLGTQSHTHVSQGENLPQDINFASPPGIKYQMHLSPLKN